MLRKGLKPIEYLIEVHTQEDEPLQASVFVGERRATRHTYICKPMVVTFSTNIAVVLGSGLTSLERTVGGS